MAEELGFTSTPQGLDPSASGYCTVFRTAGVSRPLQLELEALSAYRPQFPPGTPHENQNPSNYSHQVISDGRRRWHVVSRTGYAGSDYTGRNNHFAHHVLFGPEERPANGPAWLASRGGFLERDWNGRVEVLPAARSLPLDDGRGLARVCHAWADTVGDAGWAGRLVQMCLEAPSLPCYLIYRSSQAEMVLSLVEEALALLPPEQRWGVTFCTYYTSGGKSDCLWRGVLEGTPEAEQALRGSDRMRVFDLRSSQLGLAPASDWAEFARSGTPPAAAASVPAGSAYAPSAADGGGYGTRGGGGSRTGTLVMPRRRAAAPAEELALAELATQPAPAPAAAAMPRAAPAPPPPPPSPRASAGLGPTAITAISIGACCLGVVGALFVQGLHSGGSEQTNRRNGSLAKDDQRTIPDATPPAPGKTPAAAPEDKTSPSRTPTPAANPGPSDSGGIASGGERKPNRPNGNSGANDQSLAGSSADEKGRKSGGKPGGAVGKIDDAILAPGAVDSVEAHKEEMTDSPGDIQPKVVADGINPSSANFARLKYFESGDGKFTANGAPCRIFVPFLDDNEPTPAIEIRAVDDHKWHIRQRDKIIARLIDIGSSKWQLQSGGEAPVSAHGNGADGSTQDDGDDDGDRGADLDDEQFALLGWLAVDFGSDLVCLRGKPERRSLTKTLHSNKGMADYKLVLDANANEWPKRTELAVVVGSKGSENKALVANIASERSLVFDLHGLEPQQGYLHWNWKFPKTAALKPEITLSVSVKAPHPIEQLDAIHSVTLLYKVWGAGTDAGAAEKTGYLPIGIWTILDVQVPATKARDPK